MPAAVKILVQWLKLGRRLLAAAAKALLIPLVRRLQPPQAPLSPALWGLQTDARGTLHLHGTPLPALLRRWGSPLHVVDKQRLVQNTEAFMSASDAAEAPCLPFYSYKTNPVASVLRSCTSAASAPR